MEFKAKDGSKLIALMFANIISISGLDYILTVFFDITTQKIMEEKLIERNKDLLLAQRIANVGNWSLDPEIGVPQWSEEVYRIYERDMELGPYSLDDFHKIYRGKWWKTFNHAIQGAINEGRPYDIELKFELPGGKEKWVRAICEPHSKRGPKGHYLQGTIQDITEQKRIVEALRESEARYRTLFETISDAVYVHDVHGKLINVNTEAYERLGYTRDEILKLCVSDLDINYPSSDEVKTKIEPAIKSGHLKIESRHRAKNGLILDVELNMGIFHEKGKDIFVTVARDITERLQAEKEKEKLIASLNQALAEVKTISGLLPICMHCKKIRDDKGYWTQIESYIHDHSEAELSHGICQECAEKYYPDMDLYDDE